MYIYICIHTHIKVHFQQIGEKGTNQALSTNFHNAYI